MNDNVVICLIIGILILVDYGTGVVNAIMHDELSSEKMRIGLGHKFSYMVAVFLAWLIDFSMSYIDFGFTVPLFEPVCIGIGLVEITSILENLVKINPNMADNSILGVFRRK